MVARARKAQPAWQALGFEERGKVLRRAQKWLLDNADRVIQTISSETGKPYEDAMIEIIYGASAFGFWPKNAPKYLADERVHSASPLLKGKKLFTRYRPMGLIGVIGPWNYPLVNSFGDAIPALAAGNSVILKPASKTPLTSLLMEEAMRECGMPDDVYQVALGSGPVAEALIDAADMIMFTGSTETGKHVMRRAAETLTPVSLELGGKDPFIVLKDADLERAANVALFYSMFNGGQTCVSVERVYVEAPVYDEFVAKVVEKAQKLRQGVPNGFGVVDVGSLTLPSQVETVAEHVEDARKKGARILVGGHRGQHDGCWYEPTVMTDVNHDMECMTEETFGPTLPIMKVADEDEAIRLANDSPYGLMATLFTGDTKRGEQLSKRIEAGCVNINDSIISYSALELPMGGWKESGLGSRHGAGGIRKYCRQQGVVVSRLHPKNDVHMYPYSERKSKLLLRAFRFLWGRGKR
jgi:acyl-CoA reductase-like NAD-dependent aldehyde dehydrogenase